MKDLTRREFMQAGAGAAVGTMVANHATLLHGEQPGSQGTDSSASPAVRFGIIGVGMQGSSLLKTAVSLPGTQCVAACDLYDGRQTLAKQIAGDGIRTTRRYGELLEDKNIECLIVAAPDHWHKQLMIDAVNHGKDVYCEKPMSHSIPDGLAMVEAVQRSGRIVQIGSQRVSFPVYGKARELLRGGAIGKLMQVELSIGRNSPTGAWEYPPPPNLSPENLDWTTWLGDAPKKPFDPLTFARWRCWHQYGTGVAGDLMVHLVSGMMFITDMNQAPDQATSIGGIYKWKDGRNMPDLQLVLLEYGTVPVSVRLTLDTDTPETTRILGSNGILEIKDDVLTCTPQRGIDTSPSYYANSFPAALRDQYDRQWHAEHDAVLAQTPIAATTIYRSTTGNGLQGHLTNFFQAVRTRKPVVEDVVFGHHAAAACHMANLAYFHRRSISYQDASKETL